MTAAGKQRELARYQLADGTRAVVAQRIDGRVASATSPSTTPPASHLELAGVLDVGGDKPGCPAVIAQRRQLIDAVA